MRGRDALAKSLRAAGRRDETAAVKALRKPARAAWALDAAVAADPATGERLAETAARVAGAQTDGGDVGAAMEELRAAVRSMATAASEAAAAGGHPVEQAVLVPALLAIVGEPDALAALRAGRLAEVPPAGGFGTVPDLPSSTGAGIESRRRTGTSARSRERGRGPTRTTTAARTPAASGGGPSAATDRAVARARRSLEAADAAAATAEDRASAAEAALKDALARVDAAEGRLRTAEREVRAARQQLVNIERRAGAARDRLSAATATATAARKAFDDLGDPRL